jgi:murein DD-endopeptidase MepM/ murein hydrolase activator NlpD
MDYHSNTNKITGIWLSLGKSVLFSGLILGLFVVPAVTYASLFSAVRGLFSGQDVSAQVQSELVIESSTSSNYDSLAPANSSNPVPKEAPQLSIENGEAFISIEGPSSDAPEVVDNSNGQISIYTVRSGDTLAKIAEMFDVSVNTILWANDMSKGSALKVGQTLVILPISGVMHTVVSGDTLNTIAKKYAGDIDEIAAFNDLKITDKLSIGDKILIPDGQVSSSLRPSATTNSTSRLISSAGGPSYAGYYIKPFIGGTKTQGLHGYNGVDYGMPVGSPLYAAADGKVIIAKSSGYNGGYGNYIVIQHSNGTQTVYGHMYTLKVSVGQSVVQNELIGYSGNSGKSTGPHLHFEIRGAKNPF